MRALVHCILFCALLALCALVPARCACAWSLTGFKWPQPGGLGSNVALTYSYENMFDGSLLMPDGQPLPNSIIRQSIEEALHLWTTVAPLTFIEVPDDGKTYAAGSTQHGQIRFRHIYINGPDPEIGLPVAKAQAYYPAGGQLGGDVEFDHGDRWRIEGTLAQPDILGAAIHEIGHSLGLNHSNVEQPGQYYTYKIQNGQGNVVDAFLPKGNANMFWVFNRLDGPGSGYLFQDDIDGIRAIYGTGMGQLIPLAIPEPGALILATLGGLALFAPRRRGK